MTDKQEPVALDWSTIRDGDTLVARLEALAEARAASNSLEDDVGRVYDLGAFVRQNLPAILTALRAQAEVEAERAMLLADMADIATMGYSGAPDIAMRRIARAALERTTR